MLSQRSSPRFGSLCSIRVVPNLGRSAPCFGRPARWSGRCGSNAARQIAYRSTQRCSTNSTRCSETWFRRGELPSRPAQTECRRVTSCRRMTPAASVLGISRHSDAAQTRRAVDSLRSTPRCAERWSCDTITDLMWSPMVSAVVDCRTVALPSRGGCVLRMVGGDGTSTLLLDPLMRVGNRSNQPRWPSKIGHGSRQFGRAPSGRRHTIGSPAPGGCSATSTPNTRVVTNRPPIEFVQRCVGFDIHVEP